MIDCCAVWMVNFVIEKCLIAYYTKCIKKLNDIFLFAKVKKFK